MKKAAVFFMLFVIFFIYGICTSDVIKMVAMIGLSVMCLFVCEHLMDEEYESYKNSKNKKRRE